MPAALAGMCSRIDGIRTHRERATHVMLSADSSHDAVRIAFKAGRTRLPDQAHRCARFLDGSSPSPRAAHGERPAWRQQAAAGMAAGSPHEGTPMDGRRALTSVEGIKWASSLVRAPRRTTSTPAQRLLSREIATRRMHPAACPVNVLGTLALKGA